MIQQDLPIMHREEDKLGRAGFADQLAKTLVSAELSAGFAIGLYGEWGSGKTSLLNMVKEAVKEQDGSTITVTFNPWLCSDARQMVEQFFELLSEEVNVDSAIKDGFTKYSKKLCSFVNGIPLLTKALEKVPLVGELLSILQAAAESLETDKSIQKQKDELIVALNDFGSKIIVIIDDIDRLSSEEIAAIFQLIRSLADFPNVVYLMAFDIDIVVKSLEKVQSGNGADYLEKIIQYPIAIPAATDENIRNILQEKIEPYLKSMSLSDEEQARFRTLATEVLLPTMHNVRSTIRFTNALSIKYGLLKDEVNITDLMGVTYLQVFSPQLYNSLTFYKNDLCGTAMNKKNILLRMRGKEQESKEHLTNIKSALLNNVDAQQRVYIEEAINLLFPRLSTTQFNHFASDERSKIYNKRVCSEHCFDRYFSLNLESGAVPSAYLAELFETADITRAVELVSIICKQHKLEMLFKHLTLHFENNKYTTNIRERAKLLATAIFDNWDTIAQNYSERAQFGFGFDERSVAYQMKPILRCIHENQRADIIVNYFAKLSISAIVRILTVFEFENGRLSDSAIIDHDKVFNEMQLSEVEKAFFERITTSIGDDSLWGNLYLGRILNILESLQQNDLYDEVANYIKSHIEKDDYKLLEWVCQRLVSKGTASSATSIKDIWVVHLNQDKDVFISCDEAYTRLTSFVNQDTMNSIPSDQVLSIGAFFIEYEYRQKIKDKSQDEVLEIGRSMFGINYLGEPQITIDLIINRLEID